MDLILKYIHPGWCQTHPQESFYWHGCVLFSWSYSEEQFMSHFTQVESHFIVNFSVKSLDDSTRWWRTGGWSAPPVVQNCPYSLWLRVGHIFYKTGLTVGNNLMVWYHSLLLWTVKGICSLLQSGRERSFRDQYINQESKKPHSVETDASRGSEERGWRAKKVTGTIGPCIYLEKNIICIPSDHQNKIISCPELEGITHLLKAPWAEPQSGLVVKSLQNCVFSITW